MSPVSNIILNLFFQIFFYYVILKYYFVCGTEENKKDTLERQKQRKCIEDAIYGSIYGDIKELTKYFPNLKDMISPDISKVSKNFNLTNDESNKETEKMYDMGMLNGHFCINARTKETHTECDSSYTVISVPPQSYDGYRKLNAEFHFNINERMRIVIPMFPKLAFAYSGFMLCHHQVLDSVDPKKGIFVNLATYGNKRLFDNMLKSFRRTF